MNIVLVGFKNAGKTSVGNKLAEALHRMFIDTDQLIEAQYALTSNQSRSVREIVQHHGEEYFRQLEVNVVESLETNKNAVIATGGGVVLNPVNIASLKKHAKIVYLFASFEDLKSRTSDYLGKSFEEIYVKRQAIYPEVSDVVIDTQHKNIAEIVEELKNVQ